MFFKNFSISSVENKCITNIKRTYDYPISIQESKYMRENYKQEI